MSTSEAHLVAAYAIVALFVGIYMVRTAMRSKKLKGEIEALDATLKAGSSD